MKNTFLLNLDVLDNCSPTFQVGRAHNRISSYALKMAALFHRCLTLPSSLLRDHLRSPSLTLLSTATSTNVPLHYAITPYFFPISPSFSPGKFDIFVLLCSRFSLLPSAKATTFHFAKYLSFGCCPLLFRTRYRAAKVVFPAQFDSWPGCSITILPLQSFCTEHVFNCFLFFLHTSAPVSCLHKVNSSAKNSC